MGNKFFVNKLIQWKTIAGFHPVIVIIYIGYDATVHFQLYISDWVYFLRLDVFILKIQAGNTAFGNDEWAHHERRYSNDGGRDHIRAHHSFKTHTGGEHGYNFRVLCQLGGEKDYGDEYEQRTEQIGEVGDEVHVVFKDDLVPRSFMLH